MEMASYPGGSVLRTKETEMMQGQFIFLIEKTFLCERLQFDTVSYTDYFLSVYIQMLNYVYNLI